jgi:NADH dehydrogenase FAD-containing subunit
MVEYEVHLYSGTACITQKSTHNYPVGEKHAILLYLRAERGSEYDERKAEKLVTGAGLTGVEFSRVGKISLERVALSENKKYFDTALKNEFSLIVYSEPIV